MATLPEVHPLAAGLCSALAWHDEIGLGHGFRFVPAAIKSPEDLLSVDDFYDLMLRRSLEPPQLRLFQNSQELHPNDYLVRVASRRRAAQRLVDAVRVSQLLDQGVTVVLDALDSIHPQLELACRSLQWWLGEFAQVNAYLTTGSTAGFPLHWDDHDVLVVQISGTKEWEVRSTSRAAPMSRDASANISPSEEVVWSGVVGPGDVLHIPRGYWHVASRSSEGHSFHLTFGITQRTGADWFAWMADTSRGIEDLRRDVRGSKEAELVAAMGHWLESSNLEDFLSSRRAQAEPSRFIHSNAASPVPESIVCVAAFAPQITSGTSVGEFELRTVGKRLVFREKARQVVAALISGMPVDITSLAEQHGERTVHAIRDVLLESRVCAPMTASLRSAYTALV